MITDYFRRLVEVTGSGWNRFWFARADASGLSLLRIVTGLLVLVWLYGYSGDLVSLIGPGGLISAEFLRQWPPVQQSWAFSILGAESSPGMIWTVYFLLLGSTILFTAGCFTRVTGVSTLVGVLTLVHRMPMLGGPFEAILSPVLFYLCLAPSGAALSVDRFLAERKTKLAQTGGAAANPSTMSVAANIAVRLLQVHLAAACLIMAMSKLSGEPWWTGEAVWFLMTRADSRLVDLSSFFAREPVGVYLTNLWSYLIVGSELALTILVWNRWLRPLVLMASTLSWLLLSLITGQVLFCLLMTAATLVAFVPAEAWRVIGPLRRLLPKAESPAASTKGSYSMTVRG